VCDIFPGTSCGDPRFTGGDGNTFYFHGKKDQNFCIVSDADLHINAHFIGNHNPDLKRDFTWVQALGITFGAGHRLYIGARRAVEWDEDEDHVQITFDAEPVDIDAVKKARWVSKALPGLSVMRMDTVNTVMVELDGVFSISANAVPITDKDNRIHKYGRTEGDSLVHLDLGFQFHNLTKDVDACSGRPTALATSARWTSRRRCPSWAAHQSTSPRMVSSPRTAPSLDSAGPPATASPHSPTNKLTRTYTYIHTYIHTYI
jgi:hypothetical protein